MCFHVMYVNDTTKRFLMSLRYITPILSLTMSSLLCGSAPSSPNCAGNNSFGRAPVDLHQNASFGSVLPVGKLSRQASGAMEPDDEGGRGTPLTPLKTNIPRATTPCAKPQSELLAALRNIAEMQEVDGHENFNNLSYRELVGLAYRNHEIVRVLTSMITNDVLLSVFDDSIRQFMVGGMMQQIKRKLVSEPVIWDYFPTELKQRILSTTSDVTVLNGALTLDELASNLGLKRPEGRRRFATDDEVPVAPDVMLQILLRKPCQAAMRRGGGGFSD